MNLLELELIHMLNFPIFWGSLVHVSNFEQGIKCYNEGMIIHRLFFLFKHVALVFLALKFFYYNFFFLMLQPSWSIFQAFPSN